MNNSDFVITGLGVVAPNGIGKEAFWQSLAAGTNAISKIEAFPTDRFSVNFAAEVKGFDPKTILGLKGLRNLDNSTLFLMSAAKQAIDEAKLEINEANTDDFGVCTGTTFPHLWSMIEFDREVLQEGLDFSNPALFPSTVLNAASSQVSIRFNIQGFNSTVSTGYTSSLEALRYSLIALETNKAKTVLVGGVETLNNLLFFGFHKLGYMAGLKGIALSCPFDKRRNGPLLGEAAAMFTLETETHAKQRGVPILARVKSAASYFDAFKIGRIHPEGLGLEKAIRKALTEAKLEPKDIDYISSCANSSQDLDKIEVSVLKKIFRQNLAKIPISSIKSMIGETVSASGVLQIASCLGAMAQGIIPPTINYQEKDPDCDMDCVPNKAQKKDIKFALVTSFGPGGYNSACILEKYTDDHI
ncbi:MAG: beta-ketoacyl-[acyl-carrier-protein] synthase family protein [Candidatus Omnitrophota bacterium]|nr:beta-ketoacyl-[acyl-carrier-protein] synthase family protein [Candidatus Omnitrophota bacterium]